MSKWLISQYYSEVEKIIQYGGSRKETSIRTAFQNLLNEQLALVQQPMLILLDHLLPITPHLEPAPNQFLGFDAESPARSGYLNSHLPRSESS